MKRWLFLFVVLWPLIRRAWSSPSTQTTGDLITSSIWNQNVVANTLALKNPAQQWMDADSNADFTTTSASFANVSTTWFEVSIIADGTDLEFFVSGLVVSSNTAGTARRIDFDILQVSGSRLGGDDGMCSVITNSNTLEFPVAFTFRKGFPAGVYTFRLQWRTSGDTATIRNGSVANKEYHPQFRVQLVA